MSAAASGANGRHARYGPAGQLCRAALAVPAVGYQPNLTLTQHRYLCRHCGPTPLMHASRRAARVSGPSTAAARDTPRRRRERPVSGRLEKVWGV
jgi:hypothetical protein